MKNIFKKNQIIITALCIMIAIAGYISFTNRDASKDPDDAIETSNPDLQDILTDGSDVAQNTTDTGDADITDDTDAITDEDADLADDANAEDANADDADVKATSDADERGDISDDDLLQTAQNVSDTGEVDSKDANVPGEAVLASATLSKGFFSTAKLEREQTRSKMKENYMLIIENPDVSENLKKQAIDNMLTLTDNIEKESDTEIALQSRGFEDVVVNIAGDKVDVTVNAATITEQQTAIIEDIVKNKTGIAVKNIAITPVVMQE